MSGVFLIRLFSLVGVQVCECVWYMLVWGRHTGRSLCGWKGPRRRSGVLLYHFSLPVSFLT